MAESPHEATLASDTTAATNMISCSACGVEIPVTVVSCPHCDANQRKRGYRSKVVAGLIALIIGTFGVHRFYLGQWWGIFYLLLFWTGIPVLVALVEGIVFLSTSQRNWDNKHNEGKPPLPGELPGGTTVVVLSVVLVLAILLGIVAAIIEPTL